MFVRHRDRLLRYARRLAGGSRDPDAAEDCVQDASAEFLKKPREYHSDSHFVHLFFNFARYAFFRRKDRERAGKRGGGLGFDPLASDPGVGPPADDTGPATAAARADLHTRLLAHLAELREDYRCVIDFRLLHDLSWEEIAEKLNLQTADAARKRYGLAMDKLRKRMRGLDPDGPQERSDR